MRIQRKDGSFYDAAFTLTPLLDGEGSVVGYVSSHQDISPFKRLDRIRQQFMTNVSHELRTPVANIKLYTELLQRGVRPEKQVLYLETLAGQIARLEHMVKDILEMNVHDSDQAVKIWEEVGI